MNLMISRYHLAWLDAHPHRTKEWLRLRLMDGFHVHHVDGNHSNNNPSNLVLIEGTDHMRLHGIDMKRPWKQRRSRTRVQP
jgi:HNH endonuclease